MPVAVCVVADRQLVREVPHGDLGRSAEDQAGILVVPQPDAESRLEALMHLNEHADNPMFKIKNDPRVTRVGRFIRRYSLDELPQLFDVVLGRMSLIGPRPPLPREVAMYGLEVRRRLRVKPGLTGLWQVSGRSDLSWDEAVRLDIHYVENWSLALDLSILFRTARAVLGKDGAY